MARQKKVTKVIVNSDVTFNPAYVRNAKGNNVRKEVELKQGEYPIVGDETIYTHYGMESYLVVQNEKGYTFMIEECKTGTMSNDKTFRAV